VSSNPNLDDLCHRIERAWNDRDLDAALALYTDDIVYRDFSTGRELHGMSAVRHHVIGVFANFDMTWTVTDIAPFADTDGGIVFWRMDGGLIGGRKRISSYGLDHLEIRDGRFSRDDVYFDSAQLAPLTHSLSDIPLALTMLRRSPFLRANLPAIAHALTVQTATTALLRRPRAAAPA
jgi:ketosteroid isomerase-like protein